MTVQVAADETLLRSTMSDIAQLHGKGFMHPAPRQGILVRGQHQEGQQTRSVVSSTRVAMHMMQLNHGS